jgi:phenylacetate-CoA ligase
MNCRVAGSLFWPLTERLLGRDTLHRFRRLRQTDRAPVSALVDIQAFKLRRLLALVSENCSFYRDRIRTAGIDLADPQLGLDALKALPLLGRSDVRDHLAAMTWHDCPGGPAQPYTTGGSSGEPLQFYIDRCRQAADWAARLRARSWWKLRPGDREIMLWAGPVRRTRCDRLRIIRDRLLNQYVLDAFDMTDETMNGYADYIRRFRPHLLYGYASSLALLARHMLKRGDVLDIAAAPRAVFVTGETAAPVDSKDIERAFNSPVVIEYGARDCGVLACGCPAGRLHVVEENVIVEVLDDTGRPVGPGGVGEVVITSLESFATPFIRYRVGDLALVPDDRASQPDGLCACGRASRQLLEIRGRTTDQIIRREGDHLRRMHALSLIYVLREAEGLQQFRIVQESLDKLIVEVVADERFTPEVQHVVLQGLRGRMGSDVAIDISRQQRIEPTASGKHACVICKVRSEK